MLANNINDTINCMAIHKKQNNTDYWIYNENSKLPTVIMIHGYRGTHHGLDLIAKKLDKFQVIVPDLPGFGISKPLTGKHSVENYVKWLKSFIDELKLPEPPILLGHSFGSIITSYYAEKYPSTITKLILVNPIGAPALEGPKAIMTKLALFYYQLGCALPEKVATLWLSARPIVMIMSITMAKTKDKSTRKFIHSEHLAHFSEFTNRQVASEAFEASVKNNVRVVASKIPIKTLLIAGDKDDITPLKKQLELAEIFPSAEIKTIGNVGHLTHYETPDVVADFIVEFTE